MSNIKSWRRALRTLGKTAVRRIGHEIDTFHVPTTRETRLVRLPGGNATLLIVGGRDPEVLELNRGAFEELHCEKALQIVPGATHLFEEAGTLEHVAVLACSWFRRWLVDESGAQGGRTR